MLVLTRKRGQGVVVGAGIRIVVVEVSGEYVRLGIEAPAQVPVYREEIYRALEEENRAALAPRPAIEGFIGSTGASGTGEGFNDGEPFREKFTGDTPKPHVLITDKFS